MKQIKHLVVVTLLSLFLTSCYLLGTQGSGIKESDIRDLGEFSKIEMGVAADINITFGEKQSFTITGDDNIIGLIDSNVEAGELKITTNDFYLPIFPIVIDIVMTDLKMINLMGSGDINVKNMDAGTFVSVINGSGDINITGKAKNLDLKVNGSGDFNLFNLEAENVDARINGSGNIEVNLSNRLEAVIYGYGNIRFTGDGYIESSNIYGTGSVKRVK